MKIHRRADVSALAPEAEQAIVSWITEKAQEHKAVNRTELPNNCIAHFGSAITREWVDSFVSHYHDEVFETKVSQRRIPDSRFRAFFLKRQLKACGLIFTTHARNSSLTVMRLG
jgi:hypothetical protein